MAITKGQVDKLASLSRLELNAEESEKIRVSLEEMVEYMDQLKELDLKDVEPMMLVDATEKSWRQDEVVPGLIKEDAFKNAPAVQMDHFAIPKTVK